ncbi:hypothetical protein [Tenacibaculum amylolyticum]|uniref:hypothetical protein n=1 Tax=Tenacibaculum amylolyticum TaxID=104269 RepID=UPI0038B60106
MKEEKLFKYLAFLKAECVRHSHDEFINEDEINQLTIEIKRFKSLVNQSNQLSNFFKSKINNFNFNLTNYNEQRVKSKLL